MFGLTEEQKQLQSAVRAFAEGEIAPHVSEWDEKSEFPHEVVKKLGEMGLLGVIFPESLGGAGMGYVEYVLAIEELCGCACCDGPREGDERDFGLCGREGNEGIQAGQEREQAWSAGKRYVGADLRGL
jgi:hypothetical protein